MYQLPLVTGTFFVCKVTLTGKTGGGDISRLGIIISFN